MTTLSLPTVLVMIPRPEISPLYYSVPPSFKIGVGDCVEVELKNSKVWGIVKEFKDFPDELNGKKIKPILGKICSTPIFSDKVQTDFLKWAANYYLFPFQKIVKQIFAPLINKNNELIGDISPEKRLSALYKIEKLPQTKLNQLQQKVVDSVTSRWNNRDFRPVLLFGVTGSGKSEVFAELCRETIKRGKQVLYLTPEIGLTSGALNHLIGRIGASGVILHSSVSKKRRSSAIYCAANNLADIIAATRSAVFYPFFNIGLIVVDEEHDGSYKNLEPPYYHARDLAVMKAAALKIPIILGSATPSSDSWLNAISGKYYLETMKTRSNLKPLPKIETFPYRGDLYLPSELVDKIENSIKSKEQTLFFLNRRGFATLARCERCNEIVKCPNCDVALIYHKKSDKLLCHHCGYGLTLFKCRKCGGNLIFEGVGVEKFYEAIGDYFPKSEIISFDKDSLSTTSLFDKAVEAIIENRSQLILGTVMISKGYNFKNLKNVVIKFADYLLNFKDPRAAEKCFQLITQIAGRAGRFNLDGEVFAETTYPDHYLWKYLKKYDYEGFMAEELSWRERLFLPPFSRMITIKISGKEEKKVAAAANEIFDFLNKSIAAPEIGNFIIYPPNEPVLAKVKNRFKRNISLFFPKNLKSAAAIKSKFAEIPKFGGINVAFDVDPINEN